MISTLTLGGGPLQDTCRFPSTMKKPARPGTRPRTPPSFDPQQHYTPCTPQPASLCLSPSLQTGFRERAEAETGSEAEAAGGAVCRRVPPRRR